MKKEINVLDYATEIMNGVKNGVLLTTKANGKVNTMTISWGTLGIEWARPLFTTFVRDSRYTKEFLDANGEFTVNIPYGDFDKQILGFCGTKSGRDVDKIKELALTLEDPEIISVPGIKELPLTLECRVVYKQRQDLSALAVDSLEEYYPDDAVTGVKDVHTAYYGEIVKAYIIE
ncbi:MAG: flavin reductase family protein [Clostridiales bacterium]|nr:flavin reductase family protein [Clostridiales bacterium]